MSLQVGHVGAEVSGLDNDVVLPLRVDLIFFIVGWRLSSGGLVFTIRGVVEH